MIGPYDLPTATVHALDNVIGLDLDGTLFKSQPGIDYDDPSHLVHLAPNQDVIVQALRAMTEGWRLIVVIGRTAAVRELTEHQVHHVLGAHVPVVMQDTWKGVPALVGYKAQALCDLGICLYVGDSRWDRAAAAAAGCLFRPAGLFGNHGVPPHHAKGRQGAGSSRRPLIWRRERTASAREVLP